MASSEMKHVVARVTKILGIIIAVAPIFVAYVGSLSSQTSMFDESSGSGSAFWLVFMTVPLGFVVARVGSIVGAILESRARKISRTQPK